MNNFQAAEAIIEMASALHSVCDGARSKDDLGFAAADVNVGWALSGGNAEVLSQNETLMAASVQLLHKYRGTQLDTEEFNKLFNWHEKFRSDFMQRHDYDDWEHTMLVEQRIIRQTGSDNRREQKNVEHAQQTRKIFLDEDEESLLISFEKDDYKFPQLLEKVRVMETRSWDQSLGSWKVPFKGNTKAAVDDLVSAIFGDIHLKVVSEVELAMETGKFGTGEPGDKFLLDIEYGTGAAAGRTLLKIQCPSPWDTVWNKIGIDGMQFKQRIKTIHEFKWNSEKKYWRGDLSIDAYQYCMLIAADGGFTWSVSKDAEDALKNLEVLVNQGNEYYPQKYPEPDYENYRNEHGWKLRKYQAQGIEFIRTHRSSMLLDDMGSGKTCQALMSLDKQSRTIIVLPASLISNWIREAELWRPDLIVFVGDLRSEPAYVPPGSIMLVSNAKLHDKGKWEAGDRNKLAPLELDFDDYVLIVDECKAFKNLTAQRTHYMAHWVNEVLVAGGRVCGMDGTPITKDPRDLYIQQHVFGLAAVCWESYQQFVECHGGEFKEGYSRKKRLPSAKVNWDVTTPDQEAINQRMQCATLRRNKMDLMPWLPPQRWQDVTIDSDEINHQMDMAIAREVDEIFGPVTQENEIEVGNFISSLVDGHKGVTVQAGVMSRLRKLLACSKVKYVASDAEAFLRSAHFNGTTERLVIMTSSALAAKRLQLELEKTDGIRPGLICGSVSQKVREKIIESFQNNGTINCIVSTIGAGGQGINLFAADTMFFLDWDWSHANNEQAEARTHRSGLKADKALYVNYIVNHWIDRSVAEACGRKRNYHEIIKQTAVEVER